MDAARTMFRHSLSSTVHGIVRMYASTGRSTGYTHTTVAVIGSVSRVE